MDPLLMLLKRLADSGVEFVVIGGYAALAHGSSVVTTDMDVCAAINHEVAVKVIQSFQDLHPHWRTRPDLPEVMPDNPNLPSIKNIYLKTDLGLIDVLGELPGICSYEELAVRAEWKDLAPGLRCRVLDLDTIIAAKRHANRPKDQLVVRELEFIRRQHHRQPGLFDKPPEHT